MNLSDVDIKNLCKTHGRTFPQEAFNAHDTKRNQLNLIRELIDAHSKDFYKDIKTTRNLEIAAIYIESSAILAYSQADLFAEMVNTIILNNILPSNTVDLFKVNNELKKNHPNELEIIHAVKKVLDRESYQYLRELVNMIKHRGCAITTFKITNTENYGYGIKDFTDSKGISRKGLFWRDLFKMYDMLFEGLRQIVNAIINSNAFNPSQNNRLIIVND